MARVDLLEELPAVAGSDRLRGRRGEPHRLEDRGLGRHGHGHGARDGRALGEQVGIDQGAGLDPEPRPSRASGRRRGGHRHQRHERRRGPGLDLPASFDRSHCIATGPEWPVGGLGVRRPVGERVGPRSAFRGRIRRCHQGVRPIPPPWTVDPGHQGSGTAGASASLEAPAPASRRADRLAGPGEPGSTPGKSPGFAP